MTFVHKTSVYMTMTFVHKTSVYMTLTFVHKTSVYMTLTFVHKTSVYMTSIMSIFMYKSHVLKSHIQLSYMLNTVFIIPEVMCA